MELFLAFVLGVIFGCIVGFVVKVWMNRREKFGGTIFVTRKEDKLLYSLELEEDPERLRFKRKILFKIEKNTVRD